MIHALKNSDFLERNLVPMFPIRKVSKSKKDSWNAKLEIEKLNKDIIGAASGFWGPYGWKNYTYVDHTASGKALRSIESFIEAEVLTHYANTHTTVSHTSHRTTILRNEARDIIRQSVGALQDDEVIFCGSGSTSAVHKLLHHVAHPKNRKLIVFIGPFEHHSNILPWREAASKVIQVPANPLNGHVDLDFLAKNLKKVKQSGDKNQLIVGSFSAGSNVTGVLTDDLRATELLHEYGALAFWDYAAAAPHVPINMNPESLQGRARKDALFFSGHKFLGGPQTPGVLVVKRHVLQNPVPHGVGGGTVLYTTSTSQKYLPEVEHREEGGTPDIVGSIRLGLVFQVRNKIGVEVVMEREANYCRRVLHEWAQVPEIHILGCSRSPRLPIISFMIQHIKSGYYLHHNFVVALLNDLFGIQCRGGCMCAGPFGEVLLGVDGDSIVKLFSWDKKREKSDLAAKYSLILKPGFVRVSLNFHSSEEEVDFLVEAVKMIAKHGWRLLPFYKICMESGTFVFNTKLLDAKKQVQMEQHASLNSFNPFHYSPIPKLQMDTYQSSKIKFDFNDCLMEVKDIIHSVKETLDLTRMIVSSHPKNDVTTSYASHKRKKLRWFMIQHESALLLQNKSCPQSSTGSSFIKPQTVRIIKSLTWTEWSIPNVVSVFWNVPFKNESESTASDYGDDDTHWDGYCYYSNFHNFRFFGNIWPRYYNDLWEWKYAA